jgi:Skp family chaperone for outer membrane proteins
MRKILNCVLALVLVVGLSSCCTPSPAQKASVVEVENSHKLIATALMDYVRKDATLSDKEKGRFQTLVNTDNENIQKLKKALGE